MERLLSYDWNFFIGKSDVVSDNGLQYNIAVGYVGPDSHLYIRIFNNKDKFIMGDWVEHILYRDWYDEKDSCISKSTIEKCVEVAKLLEDLKIFA